VTVRNLRIITPTYLLVFICKMTYLYITYLPFT
jgi:hypothetical protein